MSKWLVRVLVLAMLLSFLPKAGWVASQGDDEPPPHVIDVWPLPGVEMGGNEPLTVTFDQAMDTATVESALKIEPDLEGAFAWSDPRTLNFTPSDSWGIGKTYHLTIAETATAALSGVALQEPYEFEVNTVGPLEVSTVAPGDGGENIAADATIVVTFNRPVVPLVSTDELGDLPSPLSLEPAVEGTGEWVNTSIYVFTPKVLDGGTTYTATVKAGLVSIDGAPLETDYTWSFKTLPPQVLEIYPQTGDTRILLDQKITMRFSQPMDTASVEAAFELVRGTGTEGVAGKFEWTENDTYLTFTPDELLIIDAIYRIHLAGSAKSAKGDATIGDTISYDFTTVPLPGVDYTYPANGEFNVSPGYGVAIYFLSPMKSESLKDKIVIDPAPEEWSPYVYDEQTTYLGLEFATLPKTEYTITLKAGAEDIYGNAIPDDYTFKFMTDDFDTWLQAITRGNFMLTSAYRENTRVAVNYSGTPTLDVQVHKVDITATNLANIIDYYYYYDETPDFISNDTLVRAWSHEYDGENNPNTVDDVYLASDEGGTLPNGVYWIYMESDYDYGQGSRGINKEQFALAVVTANLTVKRTPADMMIWVTDMATAEPIANTNVSVYYKNDMIGRGTTDADGIFTTPIDIPPNDPFISIVAEDETNFGIWYSNYGQELPTTQNYVYTDRPIYRPGEKVLFRGVLRNKNDMEFTVPNQRSVDVRAYTYATGTDLYKETLELTEFGTFSGEYEIPEDAPLGEVVLYVNEEWTISFNISEFRVPEYEVSVTPDKPEIIQGETLNAILNASYYFGGGVSGANLTWYMQGEYGYFNYTGQGNYSFYDETAGYPSLYQSGTTVTDANGNFILSTDTTSSGTTVPMNITIEATVTDESNQPISGRTSIMAHPANLYVGQHTDQYFGQENQPMTVDLITVLPDSSIAPETKIDLQLVEVRWERKPIEGQFGRYTWSQEEIPVLTDSVVTDENGQAQFIFTPPNGGIFRLKAMVMDELERKNASTLRFWVIGERPVWWGQPSTYLELRADKESYEPGETAKILVPLPFAGASTVLVTTERAKIMSHEVMKVEGSTLVYELLITDDHAPTIYFTVTAMKGVDEESLNPEYRYGILGITVVPKAELLNVTITPSAERAQPRDTVTFEVTTTDSTGAPVSAEVGLRLTDKAILALLSPNSVSPQDGFYGYQGNYITHNVALDGLLDTLTDLNVREEDSDEEKSGDDANQAPAPQATTEAERGAVAGEDGFADGMGGGGGGGGGQQIEPVVREDFQQTPLWEPHLVTDGDGHASIELTLPDNLTTWNMQARAFTSDTKVGESSAEVMTTLPLLVRPATPRFFVVDDRVELAMVVNNNLETDQEITARLDYEGVTLEDSATQTVTVPAGGRLRVRWMATVDDVESVALTFVAIGADGYSDASKPPLADAEGNIPVYRYTAPDTVGTAGVLREGGSSTEGIALPTRIAADSGTIKIRIDPSLAVTAIDSFTYLRNYKHQCIEQTVSRFLPNAVTYKALKDLGIEDPVMEANLFTALTEGLKILENGQNPDGGWGWFNGMESNPLVTAYAALGLIEAREAGFEVNNTMLTKALNFVRTDFIRPNRDTSQWELNRQAFYFYVLARNGQGSLEEYEDLMEFRLKMSYMARSYLLMAYLANFPDNSGVNDLTSDLTSAAILSATGAHWEEEFEDWWNWGSDTRTTAVVLTALTKAQPESDLLANAVRWLMIARQGDHWNTTQETVWSVIGLTNWMVLTGELQGNYDYSVSMNREAKLTGEVTPDNVREGAVIELPISELSTTELNRLVVARDEGTGVLYYTTHMDLRLPASEVDSLSRGVTVERQYFLAGDDETPITEAHTGDRITVRLTITVPSDIYYFVLEDPIPTGTEGVDTTLLTTSRKANVPDIQPVGDDDFYPWWYWEYDPFWYWGWWIFDRTEMRDEQVNLYADFLPEGTYVYSYDLQATTPGEFQTMPAHAYAFYMPEVFGRTVGSLFTITDPPAEEEGNTSSEEPTASPTEEPTEAPSEGEASEE